MTIYVERMFNRIIYLYSLEEKVEPSIFEDILIEIKELKESICPECEGEGEVMDSYMPDNPHLIDLPYIKCPNCGGTGVI